MAGVPARFFELSGAGLIAVGGADAAAFLQAQLTSDVLGGRPLQTHFSGYCSPKGRLLATFLVWRTGDTFVLQLPRDLRVSIQKQLSKYVLRSRVTLSDADATHCLFGVAGAHAAAALAPLSARLPQVPHEVAGVPGIYVAKLPVERYLVLAEAHKKVDVQRTLQQSAQARPDSEWTALDIEAGIPVITPETQEEFVPQMVNLDLVGGVSYSKGCYPGQEIVARTHYLGRLKQRMYRVKLPVMTTPLPGDALYSPDFGPEQASGKIVSAAPQEHGIEALAVIQTASAASREVHWKALDGPPVSFLPLPYEIPV